MSRTTYILLVIFGFTLFGCQEDVAVTPKPRMYPRVIYPEKEYKSFEESYCNFSVRIPTYSQVVKDTAFFDEKPADECWFDLTMDALNAEFNFSYLPISPANTLDKLVRDAFTMAHKHNIKADYLQEIPIQNRYGSGGVLFKIDGDVASPVQFFLTDSTHHFVRASLYFDSKANGDSIRPIVDFIGEDIDTILSTFQWIDED